MHAILMQHALHVGLLVSVMKVLGTGILGAAIAATKVFQSNDMEMWTLVKTADGDTTTGNIAHNMGPATPAGFLTPIVQATAALSLGAITTLDGTNVAVTCSATVSSGSATAQYMLILIRRR